MSDATLDAFLDILNDQNNPNYHDVPTLLTLFCADNAAMGIPSVGLTDDGPTFLLQARINDLFTQLFTSFPQLQFSPIKTRLYSGSGDKIAIQARLVTGPHVARWFQHPSGLKSKPISDIPPTGKASNLPACAVFGFDVSDCITNISIYFDRYKLALDLT